MQDSEQRGDAAISATNPPSIQSIIDLTGSENAADVSVGSHEVRYVTSPQISSLFLC